MAHPPCQPKVLLLTTDWPLSTDSSSEIHCVNKTLAHDLCLKDAQVHCTVPHFRHLLDSEHKAKKDDAQAHGVELIGAAYRAGRKEYPERSWITDYWRQYYHEGVRYGGYNGPFTHIIGYVPETYHSALDIAKEYKEDGATNVKVVLIITDIDAEEYSTKDEDITKYADEVYVLGPKLFSDYHQIHSKCTKLMPLTSSRADTVTDAVQCKADPFTNTEVDLKIVSVWPSYKHTQNAEVLDTVATAVGCAAKTLLERNQRVRWEVKGVPEQLIATVKELVSKCDAIIDVNSNSGIFNPSSYSIYVSPFTENPCDIYCLQAMQQGVPALLYTKSGLGEYLKDRSMELGNQLVTTCLVNYDSKSLENWTIAFDELLKTGKQNAVKLAERLRLWPDKGWSDLVSTIVSDAVIFPPGTAHVPLDVLEPHPVNPEVIIDQLKALNNAKPRPNKSVTSVPAPVQETTRLQCNRAWGDVFNDPFLVLLSMKLTAEMPMLAKFLNKQQHDVDRYRNDNPHNSAAQVSAMLSDYKTSSPFYRKPEQVEQLVDALIQVNRIDLALEVAGPQTALAPPRDRVRPVKQQDTTDTTDLTKRRVKCWNDKHKLRELRADTEHNYNMTQRPRGFAIIVNIREANNLLPRHGSEKDVQMIENVFSQLHFDTHLKFQDISSVDLLAELRKVADNTPELRSHNCLVVFLMGHGQKDKIYCSDGEALELKDIYSVFDKCPALRDKPKFYVIQACRTEHSSRAYDHIEYDGATSQSIEQFTLAESHYDTLLAYSSVDGTRSYRHVQHGSWFIQALMQNLCECACEEHLGDILTKVIRAVEIKSREVGYDPQTDAYVKRDQCAETVSRLKKKLYLYPGE